MNSFHDLFVWRSIHVSPDVCCPFVYRLVKMLKTRMIWWHDDRKLPYGIFVFDTSTYFTSHVISLEYHLNIYWGTNRTGVNKSLNLKPDLLVIWHILDNLQHPNALSCDSKHFFMESGWQTLEHINRVEAGSQPGQRLLPLSHRNLLLASACSQSSLWTPQALSRKHPCNLSPRPGS